MAAARELLAACPQDEILAEMLALQVCVWAGGWVGWGLQERSKLQEHRAAGAPCGRRAARVQCAAGAQLAAAQHAAQEHSREGVLIPARSI